MKHYLQEFYKAPEEQEVTLLGLQIKNLTNQEPRSSTYQKYVNSWQDFPPPSAAEWMCGRETALQHKINTN